MFETEAGRRIHAGRDLALEPGDLLLWRYFLRHAVTSVKPVPDGVGFVRILFPPQGVVVPRVPEPDAPKAVPPPAGWRSRAGALARRIGVYSFLQRLRGRTPA